MNSVLDRTDHFSGYWNGNYVYRFKHFILLFVNNLNCSTFRINYKSMLSVTTIGEAK